MSQLPIARTPTNQRRTNPEPDRDRTRGGHPSRPTTEEYVRFTDADAVREVLDAFDDEDCRAILSATVGESLTVAEITDVCDLPESTAYRKVDLLVDAGLLSESLRIRRSGHHVRTYACGIEDVTLSVDSDTIHVYVRQTGHDTDVTVGPPIYAD